MLHYIPLSGMCVASLAARCRPTRLCGIIGTGHTSSQLADTDGQGESQLPAGGETAKVGRAKVVHRGGRSRGRGRGGRATKIGS